MNHPLGIRRRVLITALIVALIFPVSMVCREISRQVQARTIRNRKVEFHRKKAEVWTRFAADRWFDGAFKYDPTLKPNLLATAAWHRRRLRVFKAASIDSLEEEELLDDLHVSQENKVINQLSTHMVDYQKAY